MLPLDPHTVMLLASQRSTELQRVAAARRVVRTVRPGRRAMRGGRAARLRALLTDLRTAAVGPDGDCVACS